METDQWLFNIHLKKWFSQSGLIVGQKWIIIVRRWKLGVGRRWERQARIPVDDPLYQEKNQYWIVFDENKGLYLLKGDKEMDQ